MESAAILELRPKIVNVIPATAELTGHLWSVDVRGANVCKDDPTTANGEEQRIPTTTTTVPTLILILTTITTTITMVIQIHTQTIIIIIITITTVLKIEMMKTTAMKTTRMISMMTMTGMKDY